MTGLSWSLILAAVGLGFIHTVLGPDHYLPFVMLARARHWSLTRTLLITTACGVGHVASSVVLGGVGLALGVAVGRLEAWETGRGDLAAWALVAFGTAYAVWGVRHALRSARGLEPHQHRGHVHLHSAGHQPHEHEAGGAASATTFWTLFLVFVLGPCEPLIPLFLLPASRGSWGMAAVVAVVFGVVTVLTMVGLTTLAVTGVRHLPLGPLERWSHAMAGVLVAACGLSVIFLGL